MNSENLNRKWRTLILLSIAELLGMSVWFSASAVVPALTQAWSLDEARAMDLISGMIPEAGLARWLRHQKLKCLYAARTRIKIQIMNAADPIYAQEIARAAREMVSPHHWMLGGLAVALRQTVLGSKTQTPQLTLRKQSISGGGIRGGLNGDPLILFRRIQSRGG